MLRLFLIALLFCSLLSSCQIPWLNCETALCYNPQPWEEMEEAEAEFDARIERCNGGDAEECCRLGVAYLKGGNRGKKDMFKAERFMLKACEGGHDICCGNVAYIYFTYDDVNWNYESGAKVLDRACGEKNATACTKLGDWHCQGKGVLYDPDKAARYFTTACEFGNTKACDKLKNIGECKLPATEQPAETVAPELDKKYLPDQNYQP